MARKRSKRDAESAELDARAEKTLAILAERIAYHERKIAEEREAKASAPRRRTLRERFGF
ncbi:MAG: hypothetical protein QOE36_1320 [Gaiellaceae bacterium]|jgi:hypothetical protein|nr:hypothetical protein [Gaiellaceae bacterium]